MPALLRAAKGLNPEQMKKLIDQANKMAGELSRGLEIPIRV